jgi:hypothetical protein
LAGHFRVGDAFAASAAVTADSAQPPGTAGAAKGGDVSRGANVAKRKVTAIQHRSSGITTRGAVTTGATRATRLSGKARACLFGRTSCAALSAGTAVTGLDPYTLEADPAEA